MPRALTGSQLDDVGSTKLFPLGTVIRVDAGARLGPTYEDYGEEEWVYVFNDGAANFAKGDIIARDADNAKPEFGGAQAAATNAIQGHAVLGVAAWAIPVGEYGFIQRRGRCEVTTGTGGCTKDLPIVSGGSAAGSGKNGTIGTDDGCFIGHFLETVAGAGLANAWINCPGS